MNDKEILDLSTTYDHQIAHYFSYLSHIGPPYPSEQFKHCAVPLLTSTQRGLQTINYRINNHMNEQQKTVTFFKHSKKEQYSYT